jgi:hypothetical protein
MPGKTKNLQLSLKCTKRCESSLWIDK